MPDRSESLITVRPPIITLPQDIDLPPRREILPGDAAITYVSARSRDTVQANSIGQDFVTFCYDSSRIAFALCDGVSQSFYGDLAARFLGTHLVDWLWHMPDFETVESFLSGLDFVLREWTTEASALVQAKPIRADLPEMQKIAIDRKRINGSESVFVAGIVDRQSDRLTLCWMGDSRLHLWDSDHQPIDLPGAIFETRERWSTRIGPKNGTPRGCMLPIGSIQRITAHSDGVGSYTDSFAFLAQDQLIAMIDALQASPTSDDVSVFDLDLHVPPEYGGWLTLETPAIRLIGDQTIGWDPIPFADSYRIAIDDGSQPFTNTFPVILQTTEFSVPIGNRLGWTHDAPYPVTCRIQAFNEYLLPSVWSAPIEMTLPPAARSQPIAIAAPSPAIVPISPESAESPIPISKLVVSDSAIVPVLIPPKRTRIASSPVIAAIVAILLLLLAVGAGLGLSALWIWFNVLQAAIRAS